MWEKDGDKKRHNHRHRHGKSQQNINWFDLFFLMESFLMIKILWIVCKHSIGIEWNILHFVRHWMCEASHAHAHVHSPHHISITFILVWPLWLKIQNCYFRSILWVTHGHWITAGRSLDTISCGLFRRPQFLCSAILHHYNSLC